MSEIMVWKPRTSQHIREFSRIR